MKHRITIKDIFNIFMLLAVILSYNAPASAFVSNVSNISGATSGADMSLQMSCHDDTSNECSDCQEMRSCDSGQCSCECTNSLQKNMALSLQSYTHGLAHSSHSTYNDFAWALYADHPTTPPII